MSKSPFKMPGMAFKEDQAPMKKVGFSKVSKAIDESDFGDTDVGGALSDITGAVGKGQDFITDTKKKINTKIAGIFGGDDEETTEESTDVSASTDIPTGTDVAGLLPESPMVKNRYPELQQNKLFGEEPDWESPVKIYNKKGDRTKY
tara:strand:+ start:221 stop:661 length:441 start_codon:yes stop_codon:yes gene_type:complete